MMTKEDYKKDMIHHLKEIASDCFLMTFNTETGKDDYSICEECPFSKICNALQSTFDNYYDATDLEDLIHR